MKDLIIAGAGGFGREIYYLVKAINEISPQWNLKGFINDIPVDLKRFHINLPVLGTIKDWVPSDNEFFAVGVASPQGKEKIVSVLKGKNAKFATLINPHARVNETVLLGEGCIINGNSTIGDCTVIGNFVNIMGSMIGQDVQIGDYSTTTGFVNVPGAKIGKRVFVGSHSVIMREVGDDAYVCVGSIVLSKVKPGAKVFGNPAKKIDI